MEKYPVLKEKTGIDKKYPRLILVHYRTNAEFGLYHFIKLAEEQPIKSIETLTDLEFNRKFPKKRCEHDKYL